MTAPKDTGSKTAMSEPVLFDADPWIESTAADVRVGDWIKGLGWPWTWTYVIRADHYPSGTVIVDTSKRPHGGYHHGYCGTPDAPVRIYNGTPPTEERAV